MSRAVGIREVAARAQVSVGTVSNVLNKPNEVSAAMLERVQRVMDEIGFVRNDLARQLKMGGGTTIGMIVLNVANPFFGELAHACETAAEELDHTVIVGSSDQLSRREDRYIDLFEEQRVRGMLIAPLDGTTERIRRLGRRGMPVVLFDVRDTEGTFCSVALDGMAGGRVATGHLIGTGRRRIAFVGGPLHQVEDRWRGAQRAVEEAPGVHLRHIDTNDHTMIEGRRIGEAIVAMPPEDRPDAIFAANDLVALGVMQALILAGDIHIPRDIAIVGYDDIDYAASAIVPLTSIRQPLETLAHESVRLLIEEAEQGADHVHRQVLLPPRLIVRRSSTIR
ncbi:LacI family DNA-binding transcriptional regulator [Microbacterium pygmaeum]|uniref:Transcriptional regulator, LacI family n=1 Tax=Microbacterium pygmaeum TaxID=370764 RepID=A0A1G7YNU0_9MICO|nr:substrate-binding domain-containing protein [Microbacterium pygmaeum]SDG98107.1 transcriptional regulator, LacI family [Microbacterium pygmaeum]